MNVGDIVWFGRANGEKTKGKIVKVNRTAYKVKLLEARGHGRGSVPGSVWNVAKGLCRASGEDGVDRRLDLNRLLARLTSAELELLKDYFAR
jgi:hypothetical protein